jgi:hypothetical protein
MRGRAARLSPKAKAVYAALAEPGTEADVVQRTQLNPKTVGARIGQDLIKAGLVEVVDKVVNQNGRKVSVYARVPHDRVEELRAEAQYRSRTKPPRERPLNLRKRMAYELFKDQDLLEALAADGATDRASARARKAAREELRAREREAAELRRHERRAADAEDPRLPFWRALREFSHGADAGRILKLMLERDVQLAKVRSAPLVDPAHWTDAVRHTTDMLTVTVALHTALHDVFGLPRTECEACGAPVVDDRDDWDVVDAEVMDDLAELVSGDD